MKFLVGAIVIIFVSIHKATTLRCWSCSSDLDPLCRDTFNQTDIISLRNGGYLYDSLQQNYNRQRNDQNYYGQRPFDQNFNNQRQYDSSSNNQRQYDPNFNNQRQYDPNFNNQRQNDPNFANRGQVNPSFNPNFNNNGQLPKLELCDENEARNRRMKNVCLKEIVRGNNYVSIIRRCEMIPLEETVGTCRQSVNKGLLLGFCENCEYDGCRIRLIFLTPSTLHPLRCLALTGFREESSSRTYSYIPIGDSLNICISRRY
ncbi:hypothetical protein JTB14_035114 [Gonioctena quinquepunctata]|nr:hypothetical protein JTB14_035114 [Gonioctena quinquepunctata]